MTFANRVALVTGGSSGIGKATCMALVERDVRVGVLACDEGEVEQVVGEIESQGGEALALVADISQPIAIQDAVQKLAAEYGRLDFVFANAGINGVWAPIEELDPQEWEQTIAVNLTGTYLTTKYALPHLVETQGAIVVTASVNGTRMFSNTGATAYACSKAAQVAFVKMTAVEFAPRGVRINVICPGAIDTDIEENTDRQDMRSIGMPARYPEGKIPLTGKHSGTSQEVAELVCFLFSDAARHITGTEVWIDGGQSLLQG